MPHFPGLAVPQLHRVFAMGRSLDVRGRTAIKGNPERARHAWQRQSLPAKHIAGDSATAQFKHSVQPAWITGLRRAWLKNPRTLAILGLEPVYGWRFNNQHKLGEIKRKAEMLEKSPKPRVVAYRETLHRTTH